MDPKKLIEQFVGAGAAGSASDMAQKARNTIQGGLSGFPGGALGGLAAGGLLGVLLGNKKMRKMAGGVAGYGGAAALGALALKAWQTWQENQQSQTGALQTAGAPAPAAPPQLQRLAADGKPFELALVRAMIAAANADGHIGPDEHRAIFEHVNRLTLDADDKAFVFDALARPASAYEIAALAGGPDQASEIWLASRLAIDPDDAREKAYLETLAGALSLPAGLAEQLERQLTQVPAPAA